nr:FG-GAP-like repeat-containing protein [Opitutus terrae]
MSAAAAFVGGSFAHAEAAPEITAVPLAPRSQPGGRTLFTTLAPEQTGVVAENRYADPRMWGELYQELTFGAMGTGVAIGDYDNDGRPDLFIVSKADASRLFRNLGDWKFEDVTEKAGLAGGGGVLDEGLAWAKRLVGSDSAGANPWTQGATFADVNNDGRLDLYLCRFAAPNLLYINQGDGTFKEEAAARGLAVTDASGMGAFCDYDRDGWLDVYVQTNMLSATAHPNGQRDYLFHNKGNGTFENVTERAGIRGESSGHSATWWDYDQDGWPDLYVANDYGVPDSLYHNNGDPAAAGFTNRLGDVVPHTPYYAMGADFGDVDNDGLFDFFVADMAGSTHEKDHRGMASSRTLIKDNNENVTATPQYLRNALYLNTGLGRMREAVFLAGFPATDWTWSPRLEDLDNDGRLDLHVTNGMVREYHNVDLLERTMAAENVNESRRIIRASPVLAEANRAYRNLGEVAFENVGVAWGLDHKGVSFGSAFGDLDGDGDLDPVFGNYQSSATVARNDSTTGHRVVIALRGTRSNRFGVGANVRLETDAGVQVRELVLARGYLSSSEPVVHFGLGDAARIRRLMVAWPSGATQVFEDLPVDQRFTITEPGAGVVVGPALAAGREQRARLPAAGERPPYGFSEVSAAAGLAVRSREEPVDERESQPLIPTRFNRRGPALVVADLDGDAQDDVLLGGTTLDPARVMARTTAQRYTLPQPLAAKAGAADDGPVLAFDVDGDGDSDVLLTRAGNNLPAGAAGYQPTLLLNDGQARFAAADPAALPALPISAGAAAAADFDRDGRLDVFIGGRVIPGHYPLAPQSALLANHSTGGEVRFENVTDALAPGLREIGMVSSALWSDVDGDGWIDLLVALEWGGVRFWRNDQGRRFEDRSVEAGFAAAGTGWWTSLAAADFNGDGRLDYAAGNVGLNTQYQASLQQPALIFFGRFADRAEPQLVEAYYEGDRLYPRRVRKELGAQTPTLLRRIPKQDLYARATLDQILGEDRLATAQRFAATELRSGVFLSQPDGRFVFSPLPRLAQIAPLQGMAAGDFDGDGKADLYGVQNSYAPVPLVGHFDGGVSQLLRGDGRGGFTLVPPAESRLLVPGDAKALVTLDLNEDGWPDFLISRNNDTALAFRNPGVVGRKSLRVALRGAAGNPDAIGARVVLELADGSNQTTEIQAGAGYSSQSSAACFFGYPATNPPRRIHIRWPSGRTTEHAVRDVSATLTIEAPR